MRRETLLLHRLRHEVRDWCRAVQGPVRAPLTTHRRSINGTPEVWDP